MLAPLEAQLPHIDPLVSGSNRPLSDTFAHQIRALVYYHTENYTSAQDLLTAARCDAFVNCLLVPKSGLGQSTFYEATATCLPLGRARGSLQMMELLDRLYKKASRCVGISFVELGELTAIDLPAAGRRQSHRRLFVDDLG